jgi:hypothetical protein
VLCGRYLYNLENVTALVNLKNMKKINYLIMSGAMFALPMVALGGLADEGGDGGRLESFIRVTLAFLNNFIVPAILALGFVFFVWGMFQYFIAGGANDEAKEKGRSLMIYATLGFVLIVIFWGIVNLLASSIGLEGDTLKNRPDLPTTR